MTLSEIKAAVIAGDKVHWSSTFYTVENHGDQWLIAGANGSAIGLTWADGETLNGIESEFFIGGKS